MEKRTYEVAARFQLVQGPMTIAPYGNGHINDTYCVICQPQEGDAIRFTEDGENWTELAPDTIVSMNMWGLTPGFLDGHIHPESSSLAMRPFAEGVLLHGTTGIMIGAVKG